MEKIDRYFKISARGGSLKTEILAGFTTFVAMSYVLAVNPMILSTTGMDKAALLTVTALSAMAASLFMGFFANMPVALAPAMGTNAYFACLWALLGRKLYRLHSITEYSFWQSP